MGIAGLVFGVVDEPGAVGRACRRIQAAFAQWPATIPDNTGGGLSA
jgi:hypothetical protein